MAIFDTGNINSIKGHQQLQRVRISVNQTLKVTNNAWKMEYDYENFDEKSDCILPIP